MAELNRDNVGAEVSKWNGGMRFKIGGNGWQPSRSLIHQPGTHFHQKLAFVLHTVNLDEIC